MTHYSRLLIIALFALQSNFSFTQDTKKASVVVNASEAVENPIYLQMMNDPEFTLKEIQDAFYLYSENNKITRGEYKQFKRWEYSATLKRDPEGRIPSDYSIFHEIENHKKKNPEVYRNATSNWMEMGPTAFPGNTSGQPNGLGRVNVVEVDPNNTNTLYIGAPDGGLWKSTDGGSSWTAKTDNLASLGVSAIVVDKNNSNTVWIGTGDRDKSDLTGAGIFKSTNGGNSFTAMNNGIPTDHAGYKKINDLVIDPENANTMYVATGRDMLKSTDGGSSWNGIGTLFYDNYIDIELKPNTTSTVYMTTGSGSFYRSTDGGATVTKTLDLSSTCTRLFIATTPLNTEYVYVIASKSNGRFHGLYRSTNSGASFTAMSLNNGTTNNIFGYENGSDNEGQGNYDLCITVDPSNAQTIYVGSINIWKSTDGGANWTKKSHWDGDISGIKGMHADQHFFKWNGNRLYIGNDAGIFYSEDGASTYSNISSGLAIAQAYKSGASASTMGMVMSGFQDNGAALLNGGTWTTVMGGDGTESAIDPNSNSYKYFAYVNGDLKRSFNDGYGEAIKGNISESGPWVTPYVLHPTISGIMFAGYTNVWRTSNCHIGNPPTWTKITSGITSSGLDLAISTPNPNIVYYSTEDGNLYRSDNALAASPTWTTLSLPSSATVNDILPHLTDENIVLIAHNNKVYKSDNKGQTWTDISSGLPNIPTYALAQYKRNSNTYYVGMEAGIYVLENGSSSWTSFNSNFPNALKVTELEFQYAAGSALVRNPNDRLIASTYGRGLWQSPPGVSVLPVKFTTFTGRKLSYNTIGLNWGTSNEVNNDKFIIQRSIDGVKFNDIGFVIGHGTSNELHNYSFVDRNPYEGANYYRLKQIDYNGDFFYSNIITVRLDLDGFKGVTLFPNPANGDQISVKINNQFEGSFDLKVYAVNGQLFYERLNVQNGIHEIGIDDFPKGMYILEVKNNFVVNTQKFMVK